MRPMYIIGGAFTALALTGFLAWTRFAPAQAPAPPPPAIPTEVMTITVAEVEVRSGAGTNCYATSKLRLGDKVEVFAKSEQTKPGWLAIKPPRGSQSWINATFIKQTSKNVGHVVTADDAPVPIKPASSLVDQEPNIESARLLRGTQVVIVGPEHYGTNAAWLPIEPPPGDVRYIPESAVSKNPTPAASNTTGFVAPPGGDQSPLAQADAALLKAQQLYQQAAQSSDQAVKAQAMSRLQSIQQTQGFLTAGQQPGNPNNSAVQPKVNLGGTGVPAQTTSGSTAALYNTQTQTGPAQWSKWGMLRRTALKQPDGSPLFRLEDDRGSPLGYAVASQGLTLEPYVDKLVCLYGATAYRSDDALRSNYTIVSQISLANR